MLRVAGVILVFVLLPACSTPVDRVADDPRSGRIVTGSAAKFRQMLASMKGKPVVVNFWATWCGPCKAEMPRLVKAAAKYADDVGFFGVDVEDDPPTAEEFAASYGVEFTSLGMSKREVEKSLDVFSLPLTQFFDKDGDLAFVHHGEIKTDELTEKIEELLLLARS